MVEWFHRLKIKEGDRGTGFVELLLLGGMDKVGVRLLVLCELANGGEDIRRVHGLLQHLKGIVSLGTKEIIKVFRAALAFGKKIIENALHVRVDVNGGSTRGRGFSAL